MTDQSVTPGDNPETLQLLDQLNRLNDKFRTPTERKVERIRQNLHRKATYFQRLFTSPDGVVVFEALKEEFDSANIFIPNDPHSTSYFLGCRDVVKYIQQMIDYDSKKEK